MNVHTLILSHNEVWHAPSLVGFATHQLPKQLKEIPELVHQAKELRSLSLAYNSISEIGPDVCRRLTNLTYLDLSGNQIKVRDNSWF